MLIGCLHFHTYIGTLSQARAHDMQKGWSVTFVIKEDIKTPGGVRHENETDILTDVTWNYYHSGIIIKELCNKTSVACTA